MSHLLSYISKMLRIKAPREQEAQQLAAGEVEGCARGGSRECCVCLSRIRAGEATRRLPCRHAFHRDCVERWLALCRRTCPLCRAYVGAGNERAAAAGAAPLDDDLVIWFSAMLVPGF